MKKTFKSLLSLFLAVFMVASLMAIPSSAASISKTSVTVTKGYQTTLTVSGASNVTWSTGDKSIATVSKGKVVGKAPGTTYVYAKAGSTTLKCKVTVVAAKITASPAEVELDSAGDSQIVTLTVKGSHSGLTVGTTNKSVATASWVKPVEWNGNKIKIKVTAKGEGTARIKVYLKKYPSTCYKYIDVTVGDSLYEDDDNTDTPTSTASNIVPLSQNVAVSANNTTSLQVYSTNIYNVGYSVTDSRIATVTAGTTSGNYKNFTVKGIAAGKTTVRFYDKTNTKKYVDVAITVSDDLKYYELYNVKPTTKLTPTDLIITVSANYATYYVLVPANYDPAYVNTIAAQKLNKYSYYEVYSARPGRMASNDTYYEFGSTNGSYGYGQRYILLPANYDKVKLNTAVAKYNNKYEYYTVYNENPAAADSWDSVKTWTVIDGATGKSITRYMLIPYYNYDQDKIDKIIADDRGASNVYTYYTIYDSYPTINAQTDNVVTYTKSGKWRYMVVPKAGVDIVKRNETIKNDTGVYEAYIMYETSPTANTAKGEYVLPMQYGSKIIYVLCTYPQGSNEHQLAYNNVSNAAPRGT